MYARFSTVHCNSRNVFQTGVCVVESGAVVPVYTEVGGALRVCIEQVQAYIQSLWIRK